MFFDFSFLQSLSFLPLPNNLAEFYDLQGNAPQAIAFYQRGFSWFGKSVR